MNIKVSKGRDFIILILEREEFEANINSLMDLGYLYTVISDKEENDLMVNSPKDYDDAVMDEMTDKCLAVLRATKQIKTNKI